MPICKLCFKDIKDTSFVQLIRTDLSLCDKCYLDMQPHFTKFSVSGYKATAIYHYDSAIRSRLYQFKGCFDIEISAIFLDRYKYYFRLKYAGYVVVPAPSYSGDNEIRGFNHVIEMFKVIGLPIVQAFRKTEHHKQTESGMAGRKDIEHYIEVNGKPDLTNKKVLLVDDVFTSGSTMKTMIKLVEKMHPKDIRILVMSKSMHTR